MNKYIEIIINAYTGYADYLWKSIINPSWHNYFYWLIGVSLFFFFLEVIMPWRKKQAIPRKDFWLDAFYMFFNFFLFSLIIYNALSEVVVNFINDLVLNTTGFNIKASNPIHSWPYWAVFLSGFFIRDFIQWWTHRLLHKVPFLWNFHKVHHSVEQMGFAAQMRYHWMENIIYNSILYIPMAILGYNLVDFFILHIFAFSWGHFNHANITVSGKVSGGIVGALIGIVLTQSLMDVHLMDSASLALKGGVFIGTVLFGVFILGPFMRILFNSPEMHIWHHAYEMPDSHPNGINFGLTLAIWDYIFGTAYVPHEGRDIKLGFHSLDKFPKDFVHQNLYGLKKEE